MRALLLLLGLLLGPVPPLAGQVEDAWDPRGLEMERSELEDLHDRLQALAGSPAYSDAVRADAARDAELIQRRLELGDFGVGDRVRLQIEGEEPLPESLPVEPGPKITLPVVGAISLAGVLRSELQDHLTREIGRFIHDPVVHSESLVRVAVLGRVTRPGFYTVPSDVLIGDAIMLAGGPAPDADMANLRVERAGEIIWSGAELERAVAEGRTLDQLNLMAGDQLMIEGTSGGGSSILRSLLLTGITLATTLLFGVRAF